jgi:hypothetical protein
MNPTPAYPVFVHQSAAGATRWDGHMCDGIASTYGPTPLAFLSATADELLLCGNRGSFRLPRAAIRKVGRGGFYPWFFSAVRVHHTMTNYPVELQFKPMQSAAGEILAQLKALGYPVN